MSRNILLVFLTVFLLTFSFGAEMWYDFQNDYASDGNGTFKIYVDSGSDGADVGYDVNIIFYDFDGNLLWSTDALTAANADGTYANFNIDFNTEGYIDANGLDLNIVIEDLNDLNIETNLEVYVPEFKDADINWHDGSKLDISDQNDLNFNFDFYDVDGITYDFNGDFKVFLYDPNNNLVDENGYDVSEEGTVSVPIEDFNTQLGKYKLLIGGEDSTEESMGYKTFTFDVLAFDLTAFVKNDF